MIQKSVRFSLALSLVLMFLGNDAFAASVTWPTRGTQVTCGVSIEGETVEVIQSAIEDHLMAESKSGRALVFIDLSKPGSAHLVVGEFIADADDERRERVLNSLPKEDSDFLRHLSTRRVSEMYMGLTDGYFHIRNDFGNRYISISCEETPTNDLTS